MMSIGSRIKELREKRGIAQTTLAQKVGVTPAMICWIERGSKNPSIQTGKLIADALGCSVDELLN